MKKLNINEVEKGKLLRISDLKREQKELLLRLNTKKRKAVLYEKNNVLKIMLEKNRAEEYELRKF